MLTRRSFIGKTLAAGLGVFSVPYILPSQRLFAPSGNRMVNHVVFVMFAGGIRNFESLEKREGNLMPNMLPGQEAISKDILRSINPLPKIRERPLSKEGVLFKNFRFNSTKTIHYTGHAISIMGAYTGNIQLMRPLSYPSVFEYYRKYNSPTATALNSWWICDKAGPFPYLNYSSYPGYGAKYGANMLQASSFFNKHVQALATLPNSDYLMRQELTQFFNSQAAGMIDYNTIGGMVNDEASRIKIKAFLSSYASEVLNEEFNPWGISRSINPDVLNMYTAQRVIQTFKPELLVVNMQESDIAHSHFTKYCSNLHIADFALAKLWNTIQETPGMANDTILIAAPEFGRNAEHNTILDENGRYAVDHTGDENSKKIFCLILGPEGKVKQDLVISDTVGESIDIAPTICDILGFSDKLQSTPMQGKSLRNFISK